MDLYFSVCKQKLTREDDELLASYSKNHVRCNFKTDKTWALMEKYALFIDVNNNKSLVKLGFGHKVACMVPEEILKGNYFSVSLFGDDRLTTTQENILIQPSGFSDAVQDALDNGDSETTSDSFTTYRKRRVIDEHDEYLLKSPQREEHLYY